MVIMWLRAVAVLAVTKSALQRLLLILASADYTIACLTLTGLSVWGF